MTVLGRSLVAIATSGWLVPLCVSYWATHDFLWNVVWPAAAFDKPYDAPWHAFSFADELFYLSMLWLAFVLIGWSFALTRRKDRS